MRKIPCTDCEYYNTLPDGVISCFGVQDVQFYWTEDIADMINRCPKGWKARKKSATDVTVWREEKKD